VLVTSSPWKLAAALLVAVVASDPPAAGAIEAHSAPPTPTAAEDVSFSNGAVQLKGVLYKPDGPGPFPVLLFNHGSAPGMLNGQAFEKLGPMFVQHEWAFFAPYRRGQGLSAAAGPYVMDVIQKEQTAAIVRALPVLIVVFGVLLAVVVLTTRRQPLWVRLCAGFIVFLIGTLGAHLISEHARANATIHALETDQFSDHLAAFEWLRRQSFVMPGRIATMGNSFGGIITVFAAERIPYCAVVDASGGAQTWSPELSKRLASSVRQSQAPIFFFQAENDYSLAPTEVLGKAMRDAGKPSVVKIYPAFGASAADGHSFAWRGSDYWETDVFRFLDAQCR
jgi:dienelactone hydrolase